MSERLHQQLLDRLNVIGEIDWSRPVVDSTAASPARRSMTCATGRGIPLAVLISTANTHDSQPLMPLLDSLPQTRSRRGRARQPPDRLHADKAYDQPALPREVRRHGIAVRIVRTAVQSSQRLGRHRWIIEARLSWLLRNRRLIHRYDRKADHFKAFADLGCILICHQRLIKATK